MKKLIVKRSILLFLVVFILLLIPQSFRKANIIKDKDNSEISFNNDLFSSDLTDPGVVVEDLVSMTDLYNVIEQGRINDLDENVIVSNIENLVGTKRVSIDSAHELYLFGNAQSYNFDQQGGIVSFADINDEVNTSVMKKVLDLDYVLLNDIDYSVKKAQKFVPIGTNLELESGVISTQPISLKAPFTGSFDGNGFEIKNLYLAEHSYVTITIQDDEESSAVTVVLFKQYAMFANIGSSGVVKNFVLKNPILEITTIDSSSGLLQTAMLAGENSGTISNVGVIDEKVSAQGPGIIFDVLYPSNETYTAAAFVYDNKGVINNSYFVGSNVVVSSLNYRFSGIAPFFYENSGTINNSLYSDNVITKVDLNNPKDYTNAGLESHSLSDIKIGNTNLNSSSSLGSPWYFYELDGYPSLKGLQYSNGEYLINNDLELMYFSQLLNLITPVNGKSFDMHKYRIVDHINMKNFKFYKTPSAVFRGELYGGNVNFTLNSNVNNNKYIYNLTLQTPHIQGNSYHLGLFSRLSGTVRNINIFNSNIILTNTNSHYGKTINVGFVTAELTGGTIKNIISNANTNLGTNAIGLVYAGGLVGIGNGEISYVSTNGLVDGGKHNFNNYTIVPNFYVGGIIGTNNGAININYSFNNGTVKGVGTLNTNYNANTNTAKTFTGGIIGEVNNITESSNSLVYLTNNGLIDANDFQGKNNNLIAHQYVGGIFGSVKGYGFKLNEGSSVKNGRFENTGNVKGSYINTHTKLFAAGIGVMNTNYVNANISYLTNSGTYEFNNFNYQTHNKYIYYASTITDNTDAGIILSTAYNETDFNISGSYFTQNLGITNPNEILISMFFASVNNASSKLLYSENKGDLTVGNTSGDTVVNQLLKISNITQATRVDYKNVFNSGDINVLRINNTSDSIYVAGVSFVLSYDNRTYLMENVVNEGNIVTAGIKGNSEVIGNVEGKQFNSTAPFRSTLVARNLYVAGIVNLNAGEITNSFNLGNITSTYNSQIRNINGNANAFVGGINTFNYNLIKNVANSGLINYVNDSVTSESHFAGNDNITGQNINTFGGITITYTGGVTIGGIVAALGDKEGTEISPHAININEVAQVIDTVNNGDLFGKSEEYVRAGGILGIALSVELTAGTFNNTSESSEIVAGPFTKAEIGQSDPIGESLLSNGLNFGNISAITLNIGQYSGALSNLTGQQSNPTALRPGINSSAGGVIGYGLTQMVRMINHGTISATDVAGGIVGATYILGGENANTSPTTDVNINTAVHYGKIKAARTSGYANINYNENETYGTTNYYPDNDQTFVFANANTYDLALAPNRKRGFGGIFGRMQRGVYGKMRSSNFNNIMNMDPNIDMVGRVDANAPGSLMYYRFFNGEETYYSARENDSTSYSLFGWNNRMSTFDFNGATVRFEIQRVRNGFFGSYVSYVTKIEVLSGTVMRTDQIVRRKMNVNDSGTSDVITHTEVLELTGVIFEGDTSGFTNNTAANFGLPANASSNTYDRSNYTHITSNQVYRTDFSTVNTNFSPDELRVVGIVRHNPNTNHNYIFDPSFPLMQPENSEFIYPVEQDALALRFQNIGTNPMPNGMYVLSSSTGSIDGAALPTNMKIIALFKLDESEFKYIDFNNVSLNDLVESSSYVTKLQNSYDDMKQLNFNDKSEILAEDANVTPLIAELDLYDPTGNSPILTGGVIDRSTNTITYNISNDSFSGNTVNYQVLRNELSNNAIIAKANISETDYYNDFRTDYDNRENNLLPAGSNFIETYNATFNNNVATFTIRVYSEIYVKDQNIYELDKYYTDYTIRIVRANNNLDVDASIQIDNNTPIINNNTDVVITNPLMQPNGMLTATFTDLNDILPDNHKLVVEGLYLNNEVINENYYNIEINPKNNNQFGFKVNLNDELEANTYEIRYRFYNSSTIRSITFSKANSTDYSILNVSYDTYSNDLMGNDSSFIKTNTNFNTYIKFGYMFDNVTTNNQTLTLVENNYQVNYLYMDSLDYYELYLNNEHILNIKLAKFARLTKAIIRYEYNSNGIKEYILTYEILPESGSSEIITHRIIERDVNERTIYLDANLQSTDINDLNRISITRENELSTLIVNYNFINSELYDNLDVYLNNNELLVFDSDALAYNYDPNILAYILNTNDNYLTIQITKNLLQGNHDFNLTIARENNVYNLTDIYIYKELGVSGYLEDIRFTLSDDDTIFEYPTIRPSDSNGNPLTTSNLPDTRVYINGIDYDHADELGYQHFRINGKVSDVDLEHFTPIFRLPPGAMISRFDNETNTWTAYYNLSEEENDLAANFISFDGESEELVTYRIRSEDENEVIYYHITLSDIRYNLTIRFKVYYKFPDGSIIEANDLLSPIENEAIIINLKNLKLIENITDRLPNPNKNIIEDVNDFPILQQGDIIGLNNQSTLFYFTPNSSTTNYRFGRNMSGGYSFSVVTPKHRPTSPIQNENLIVNKRYNYEMYMVPRELTNTLDWHTNIYKLPKLAQEGYQGYHYHVINPSQNPIIRELAIVILSETADPEWGLNDEFGT